MKQEVVLEPGLWMPAASMTLLAARLARAGYRPRLFSYRGRSPLEASIERLAQFAPSEPAHYVGYSLGGLVMLETLTRHPEIAVRSVLLLGSPVRGCLAGRRFGRHRPGRWMMGACGALWEERE
ncbi:MAG TPA: alpha/beta fold hydrolase, partial [Burkholderiales bacterium]